DQAIQLAQIVARKTKVVQVDDVDCLSAIEQSQDDTFAEIGRNGRNADVDVATRNPQPDSSILRQALFSDVERRDDFDARSYCGLESFRRFEHIVEHSVDTKPHHHVAFKHLDVDIACAVFDRL